MDFSLSEEQLRWRDVARKFVAEIIKPDVLTPRPAANGGGAHPVGLDQAGRRARPAHPRHPQELWRRRRRYPDHVHRRRGAGRRRSRLRRDPRPVLEVFPPVRRSDDARTATRFIPLFVDDPGRGHGARLYRARRRFGPSGLLRCAGDRLPDHRRPGWRRATSSTAPSATSPTAAWPRSISSLPASTPSKKLSESGADLRRHLRHAGLPRRLLPRKEQPAARHQRHLSFRKLPRAGGRTCWSARACSPNCEPNTCRAARPRPPRPCSASAARRTNTRSTTPSGAFRAASRWSSSRRWR